MKRSLFTVAAALCLSSASLAAAQDLDCPEPAAVFTAADAGAFDLPKLARDVGSAELDGDALGKIVGKIRSDYPEATDAEVADIMITAFCTYLNTDTPADHRSEEHVSAFEQQAYDAVFNGPAPESYPRQGWLYGN